MDKQRFKAILAAYGADPRAWPEAERAAAQALCAAVDAEIAAALGQAREVDALVALEFGAYGDGAARSAPNPDVSRFLGADFHRRRSGFVDDWRGPALALAACAACGVLIGYGAGVGVAPAGAAEALIDQAFGAAPFELADPGEEG